jgi:hypothetical protein
MIMEVVMNDASTLREEAISWMSRDKWQYYLTLNLNRGLPRWKATNAFGEFCQRVDRQLLGPKYAKYPERRVLVWGIPEHIRSNIHFHGLMKIDQIVEFSKLTSLVEESWKSVVSSGTTDLQKIYDLRPLVRYMTKEFVRPNHFERIVFSEDFWPSDENYRAPKDLPNRQLFP